ncbi:hypothetical protein NHF40_08955 [Maricaulaceae bacterium EIL42A08]|nr:hypothetical protein [Maricaulaceae bacterium EIL42A08]
MTRARAFLFIGGGLLALYYLAEAVFEYGQVPVLTRHQPALILRYDVRQADQLVSDMPSLSGVVRSDLTVVRHSAGIDPTIQGAIYYSDFLLMWTLEPRLEGFTTRVRPFRARWSSEPDPEAIDAAMIALGQHVEQTAGTRAIFLSVEELRAS